jgi:hypothetical protein
MKQVFQFHKLGKRFVLPLIVFTISLAATAQTDFHTPLIQSREIELVKKYDQVEVIGDVTIILTDNLEGKLVFRGNLKEVQAAKVSIKNKKLIIDANRKRGAGKFTVYLPASTMRLLIASGKTEILSSGTIKTRDLEIFLNGSSYVSVRYDGKLNIVPGAGFELIGNPNLSRE